MSGQDTDGERAALANYTLTSGGDAISAFRTGRPPQDERPSFQIALVGGRLNVEGSFTLCDEVDSFIEALQVAAASHLAAAEPVAEAAPKKKKRRAGSGAWRKVTPGSFADQVLKAVIKLKTDDVRKIARAIGRENAQGIHMAITNMRRGGLLNGVAAAVWA